MTHTVSVLSFESQQSGDPSGQLATLSALRRSAGFRTGAVIGVTEGWAAPVARIRYDAQSEHLLPAAGEMILSVFDRGALFERLDGRWAGRRGGYSRSTVALSNGESERRYAALNESGVSQIYFGRLLFERLSDCLVEGVRCSSDVSERMFENDESLARLAHEYVESAANPDGVPSLLEMDARAVILLLTLLRGFPRGAAVERTKLRAMNRREITLLMDYIEANLGEPIRLHELAAIARCSEGHFSALFKHSFGVSPHRYLVSRRLEAAKTMLLASGNLVDIALDCGFASQQHFSTAFRNAFGRTPTAWRREHARRACDEDQSLP